MAQKSLKLYTYKDDPRTKRILIAANYLGLKLEMPPVDLEKDLKSKDFLNMNPMGKIPVLDAGEGFVFESNAIARYLARQEPSKNLLGHSMIETAQVDQWLDFTASELEPAVLAWVGPVMGYIPYNSEIHKQAVENVKAALAALNMHLEKHTYLVGERISLADIVAATVLVPLYQKVLEPRVRNPYHSVNRWFETICQQENFSSVLKLESTSWCTVAQKPKVTEKKQEKSKEKSKEEKPKEHKEEKKKEEKPKESKKKAKEEVDDDEEEDEGEKEEKKPDPLALLPKSTFILDEFKREYSNKSVDESSEYLFKNFDPAGYTAYWCNYKYNSENTVLFRTCNLIGGFFQRMEKMHKYAFGVMLIVGTEKLHDITGFWLIRGKEIPAHMNEEVPDTELYEWKPMPWPGELEANKQRIKTFLAWEAVDGKECLEGKAFK